MKSTIVRKNKTRINRAERLEPFFLVALISVAIAIWVAVKVEYGY